jgi:hypothetical protein
MPSEIAHVKSLTRSPSVSCLIPALNPLRPEPPHPPDDSLKRLPTHTPVLRTRWMELLPSNVNAEICPPKHSILDRRPSFPYIEHTRYSTPFTTPPEHQKSSEVQAEELSAALESLSRRPHTISHGKRRVWPAMANTTLPRRVKFSSSHGLRNQPATPDVAFCPALPSRRDSTHGSRQKSKPPPSSLVTESKIGRHLSSPGSGKSFQKHDISVARAQTVTLRDRLSNPLNPDTHNAGQETEYSQSRRTSGSLPKRKPTLVKELSDFFASRTGK